MRITSNIIKGVLGAASACTLLLGVTTFSQEAVAGISNTRHNLSSQTNSIAGRNQTSSTSDLCVFCHTPHGADVTNPAENPPLWNKRLAAPAGFTTYAQLNSATIDGQILGVGSTSVACLSCHDGSQAMDNIINAPGSGGFDTTGGGVSGRNFTWTGGGVDANGFLISVANLGKDLSNDHPIGIQYCGGFTGGTTGACRDPDFRAPATVTGAGGAVTAWYVDTSTFQGAATTTRDKTDMILFNRAFTAGTGPSVECGTCHDPHAEAIAAGQVAFLRVTNAGSNLCLACHVK